MLFSSNILLSKLEKKVRQKSYPPEAAENSVINF